MAQSITLPKAGSSRNLPKAEEQTFLMETRDGMLVNVPESRMEAFLKAQQEDSPAPLSREERQLVEALKAEILGR